MSATALFGNKAVAALGIGELGGCVYNGILQGAALLSKIKNKKQKFKQAIQKLNILFLLRRLLNL